MSVSISKTFLSEAPRTAAKFADIKLFPSDAVGPVTRNVLIYGYRSLRIAMQRGGILRTRPQDRLGQGTWSNCDDLPVVFRRAKRPDCTLLSGMVP